jgi:hypothetical protein
MPIDRESAATKPFEAGAQHRFLARLVGDYRGTASTWLEPGAPPAVEPIHGQFRPLLGGRFAAFTYESALTGTPIAGELLLAWETGARRWSAAWIDSFHTGTSILSSVGERDREAIEVLGDYFAGEGQPRWGWRTRLLLESGEIESDERVVIEMDNIMPGTSDEFPGVRIVLTRTGR